MNLTIDALSLSRVANLIGEPARIQMLTSLLDGKSHSASELALVAGASAQAASSHLAKLTSSGFIAREHKGRQRLYRLKNADVAAAVEALGALARPALPSSMPELTFARTCYDHLAGALAIALRDGMLKNGSLRQEADRFVVTRAGECFLLGLDINLEPLRLLRRSFARTCLDWTERRPHIGGAVGAALLSCFFEKKWVARMRNTRALRLTHAGERAFDQVFGLRPAVIRSREN
jgi:DNA-binding transcriptional ArsR family regulator